MNKTGILPNCCRVGTIAWLQNMDMYGNNTETVVANVVDYDIRVGID